LQVGLTQRVLFHKGRAYDSIEHGWYQYLKNHTLTFIANRTDQDFIQLAKDLDLLIITGGDDHPVRRVTELKLASAMMALGKPILGVCHGCFLLVDVLRGEVGEVADHRDTEHFVNYFGNPVLVNSYHNQAITRLHDSGTILCTDEQGLCEAWIDDNLAGVVWHPERMATPWLPDEIQNLIKV
jgi:gamma-glutamyl-gamma-aminobutyrate hydrolase PuuD